jgi:solute:Na+ symporter, SSS family
MIQFSILDYAIFAFYFLSVIFISAILSRKIKGMESYLLAGRRLTLPLFVGSLVSTWYGGIIGVGEISYSAGIYNLITQGFFWYISYIIFALFLAQRLRRSNQYTLPDQLEIFYGKSARKVGLFLNFFNVVPIVYVISLGVMLEVLFNIPLTTGIIIGGLFCMAYTMLGGFSADIYTDFMQFIFMCIGVAVLIPFCFIKLGGWSYLVMNTPESHWSLTGGYPITELLVWGFIAMTTLVDPNFYQRCYAAKEPKIAKNGILIAVVFWLLFDICTTFAGIYARAALPGIDPKHAYPLLANLVLPPVFKGIFFTGMLATIMSTVDSYFFVAATTLSRDLYQRVLNPQASEKQVVRMTRLGILFTGTLSIVMALGLYESIKNVWKLFGCH